MKFSNIQHSNKSPIICLLIFTTLFSLLIVHFCITFKVLPKRATPTNQPTKNPSTSTYTIRHTTTTSTQNQWYQLHFYDNTSFSNPRFSTNNKKGENCWTINPEISFKAEHAVDGNFIQTPYYLFAKPAQTAISADFLLDLDGRFVNFIRIYPEQKGQNRFDNYGYMVVYISSQPFDYSNQNGESINGKPPGYPLNEVECSPRFLYDKEKMEELDKVNAPMLFDCRENVLSTRFLRVSNQAHYGTEQDYVQIIEIQVGYQS